MTKTILSVFLEKENAERAVDQLKAAGYDAKDISIIMKDHADVVNTADTGSTALEDTATGATTGGLVGGLTGLLVGIGALAIPGIGALFLAGPIAAALGVTGVAATTLSGVLTGALAGGIIGALTSLGVSEEDAHYYEAQIREGAIVVAVPVRDGLESHVSQILTSNHADKIQTLTQKEPSYDPAAHNTTVTDTPYAGMKGGESVADTDDAVREDAWREENEEWRSENAVDRVDDAVVPSSSVPYGRTMVEEPSKDAPTRQPVREYDETY